MGILWLTLRVTYGHTALTCVFTVVAKLYILQSFYYHAVLLNNVLINTCRHSCPESNWYNFILHNCDNIWYMFFETRNLYVLSVSQTDQKKVVSEGYHMHCDIWPAFRTMAVPWST